MGSGRLRHQPPLVLFIAANVLFATGLIVHAFLYNFYLEALGVSAEGMGHAAAALTAGSLVTLLPGGVLADRAGPRTTVIAGSLVLTVGLCFGAFVTTPLAAFCAAVVAGMGSGLWRVAMAPVLMRLTQASTRARAFAWNIGLLAAWNGAGVWVGGAAVTWLEARWGLPRLTALRATLLVGAAGSAASFFLYRALRLSADPSTPEMPATPSTPADSHTARATLPLIGLLTVWLIGPALCSQFLNIFFSHVHRLAIERIGLLFAAASWCWALAVLASGELATRVGVRRVLFASMLAFAPAIWGLSLAAHVGLAVALYFVQGLIAPLATPLIDQWLLGQVPADRQGVVSSWRQVAADVSAMVGASLGGHLLAATSFHTLFVVAGSIAFVGALGIMLSPRARPRR